MKIKPVELIRTKEQIYKDLDIKNKNYSDEELIDLMVKYPDLVQRPIIEIGDKAILARPAERIKELFNGFICSPNENKNKFSLILT